MFKVFKRWQFSLFLALLVALSFTNLAFSDTLPNTFKGQVVVLEKSLDADQHIEELIKQAADEGGTIESIEINHLGKNIPPQLQYFIDELHAKHIKFYFTWFKNPEEISKKLKEVAESDLTEAKAQYESLRYDLLNNTGAILPKFNPKTFREKTSEIGRNWDHFFGLLENQGTSWETYHVKRSVNMKRTEAAIAIGKNIFSAVLMYNVLKPLEISRGQMNIILPIMISTGFGLAFDYWQQGNSTFKGQGKTYDFNSQRFEVNRKFMSMWQLIHSFVVRQSVLAAAGVIFNSNFKESFNFAQSLPSFIDAANPFYFIVHFPIHFRSEAVVPYILPTMLVTLTGFLSKTFPELFLRRVQISKGQKYYVIGNTFWTLLCTSMVTMNQFEYGTLARNTLIALGSAGFLYESVKAFLNPSSLAHRTSVRLLDWALQRESSKHCETLLTIKKASTSLVTPDET